MKRLTPSQEQVLVRMSIQRQWVCLDVLSGVGLVESLRRARCRKKLFHEYQAQEKELSEFGLVTPYDFYEALVASRVVPMSFSDWIIHCWLGLDYLKERGLA